MREKEASTNETAMFVYILLLRANLLRSSSVWEPFQNPVLLHITGYVHGAAEEELRVM